MEEDTPEQFVSIEWIGLHNYLCEKVSPDTERTRGANCTSADAAVMFERTDGLRQIVLIEWKYTESYSGVPLQFSSSGTSRVKIYLPLYHAPDCPINKSLLDDFSHLFYEPFYQLMRQQFLAWQMERARELGADIVSVLHISPAHNRDFHKVTSPGLRNLGSSVLDIWQSLLCSPDRFKSISIEKLFGSFPIEEFVELRDWWNYISQRYLWLTDNRGA